MTFAKLLILASIPVAAPVFASGGTRPQTETLGAAEQPRPDSRMPLDPEAGTRYAVLRDLFHQANGAPIASEYQNWAEYQVNPMQKCVQIFKDAPNTFDSGVLLLRMDALGHNSGPAFPNEKQSKIIFVQYSTMINSTDEMLTYRHWNISLQHSTPVQLEATWPELSAYLIRKSGTLTIWEGRYRGYESSKMDQLLYGYCFPESEPNPVN